MSHLDYAKYRIQIGWNCLNPCCNGCRTWTNREMFGYTNKLSNVLILVVMDVALGPVNYSCFELSGVVLILVVMDVALGQIFY